MEDIRAPDEHFFATLNHNPHKGVPGAYTGNKITFWLIFKIGLTLVWLRATYEGRDGPCMPNILVHYYRPRSRGDNAIGSIRLPVLPKHKTQYTPKQKCYQSMCL